MAGEEFDDGGFASHEIDEIATGLKGCLPAAFVGVIGIIAVLIWAVGGGGDLFGGDKDRADASEETTTSTTTTVAEETGQAFTPPTPEDLPAGAQLFQGTSGGEIGCITCDG